MGDANINCQLCDGLVYESEGIWSCQYTGVYSGSQNVYAGDCPYHPGEPSKGPLVEEEN